MESFRLVFFVAQPLTFTLVGERDDFYGSNDEQFLRWFFKGPSMNAPKKKGVNISFP